MSRHLAAFQVLRDRPLRIKKGARCKLKVEPMSGITGKYALLAYKVWTSGKPMNYRIEIVDYHAAPDKVTPIVYSEAAISNRTPNGWWEAFSASAARTGDDVIFRVTTGEGSLYISDVVLWVMRN